jgi:hypothetical protein
MEGVLPEEFPFSKRREEKAPDAPAPVAVSAPIAAPAPENVATTQATDATPFVAAPVAAPRVEHVEEEPLVEIATSGRVVYRGRERRRSPRQALRAKAVYRDEINTATSGPVQVLNISMFGVRIWSPRPMQAGDRGNIRLELGPVKWASMMRVVMAEAVDGEGYIMGCEFVAKELPRRRVDAA